MRMRSALRRKTMWSLGVAVLFGFGCVTGAAATPVTLQDYTGRGFAPDLVNYTLQVIL
ncbi:MAG: hypothetical protein ACYTGH_22250 [Planctomycetota bacterium]